MKRINALTIAGTDPSGGAGIQADLKAFSALGAYGCSAITALVAQNTRGVQSVYRIEPDFVAAQLDSVFSDVAYRYHQNRHAGGDRYCGSRGRAAGALPGGQRGAGYRHAGESGDPLLSASAVETLRQRLLPQVSLITPDLPEAALYSMPPCA